MALLADTRISRGERGKQRALDVEKDTNNEPVNDTSLQSPSSTEESGSFSRRLKLIERFLVSHSLETRGIKRVDLSERHDSTKPGYLQIAVLWFSINLAANNVTLGMLGSAVFGLGFTDASLCAVFGMLVGCLPTAYTATIGPRSGCRTMIFARYAMGWYPAKLVVLLNIIVLLGYSLIDCVIAGQILAAVSGGSMSVVVGIIVVAVITWVVTTFGYRFFHYYERYSWIPNLVVFCILLGVAGPKFDTTTPSEIKDARTLAGNRLSFFGLCLAAAITYSGGAADYFVYYPESTPRWRVFGMTMLGLSTSFTFAFMLGVGLASGITRHATWSAAYTTSQGALIVTAYEPLGDFGRFCGVLVALGLVANLIPPTYSSGVDFQMLGRRLFQPVPRAAWNTIGVVVYTVCALAGRDHLAEIFTNFLAVMGYWVSIWIAITLEEHAIFRRRDGFDWSLWDKRSSLPLGGAALIAFLVGWVGAVLSMAQVWYIGPIAQLVGKYGADMGNYVGFAWAALVFPPLRYLELKKFGR